MTEQVIVLKLEPELVSKIDERRQGLTREDYVRLCIVNMLGNGSKTTLPEANTAGSPTAQDYVTKEDFEQFKAEIEKYHFDLASLLTRFCQEHAGELNASSSPHFYEQFIKLLQS